MPTQAPIRKRPDSLSSGPAFARPASPPDRFRKQAAYVVLLCVFSVVALLMVWQIRAILLLLFAAFLGALTLTTLTAALQKWLPLGRAAAFTLVIILLVAVATLGIWLRGPALAQQLSDLQFDIAAAAQQMLSRIEAQPWARWLLGHFGGADQVARASSMLLSGIGGAVYLTASTLVGLFFVGITSLYLAAEPAFYLRGLRRILPPAHRATIEACFSASTQILRIWILAKILSMAIIGLFITAGLLVLRVPLPGTLGTIAAVLTFIPNLGPILSVVPAALLAFAISPTKGILTIGWFALAHLLESNLVTPLAERKIVRLPPALTLTMQLVLALFAGFWGLALAAPLTAVVLGVAGVLLPPLPSPPPPPAGPASQSEKSDAVIQAS